jgi:Acetyltransferase (GNAT) domain
MNYEILHDFPAHKPQAAWRDLLARLEMPSHYNTPEFFLEPFWEGKRPFAILALEGDRAVAVLTGIHEADHVVCGLQSRPQIEVDPNADTIAALQSLLQGLLTEAGGAKLLCVYSWPSLDLPPFEEQGFRRRQFEGNVVLDLTQGPEVLFRQFSENRRRNIRAAEKYGITVRVANKKEDILSAYDVYLRWQKTVRKKVKENTRTFEHFENAHRLLKNRRLFLAELSGKVIAISMFRFYSGGLFEYAANCSLDEFLHRKPNDLLQWKGIEWACSQGLRRYSLGGAHSFLMRSGGTVVPILRYRLDRTLLRKHDLQEKVADNARKTFRQLPQSLQERIRRVLGKKH